eukprot:1047977-Rhodomonas_salina.1
MAGAALLVDATVAASVTDEGARASCGQPEGRGAGGGRRRERGEVRYRPTRVLGAVRPARSAGCGRQRIVMPAACGRDLAGWDVTWQPTWT